MALFDYMYVYVYMEGALRVVTARELVIFSGFLASESKSVRRCRHLCGHASHDRHTVSSVEGREIKINKPPPRTTRIEPRPLV